MTTQPKLLDKPVGPIGYGLMGLTWRSKPPTKSQSFEAMNMALNQGANMWNGGEIYGPPNRNSLHLLQEYFTQYPEAADKVILNIKGGVNVKELRPDGTKENVRQSVENCLSILNGTKKIDIFECARVDPNIPIEETITTLKELIDQGKIGGIGLSEVKSSTITRANKIHPISTIEVELSLWSPDILFNGVATTCSKLKIPITAYSPLCRGALAGSTFKSNSDLPEDSPIKGYPKFQDEVLDYNNKITDLVKSIVKKHKEENWTISQVAIAWVRGLQGKEFSDPETKEKIKLGIITPIPGSTTSERVKENCRIIELSDEEMDLLNKMIEENPTKGGRYTEHHSKYLEG